MVALFEIKASLSFKGFRSVAVHPGRFMDTNGKKLDGFWIVVGLRQNGCKMPYTFRKGIYWDN